MSIRRKWVWLGAIASLFWNTTILANETPSESLLVQNTELGCRQTNATTGVYSQPNLDSFSRGILDQEQTVRLESKGEGWARISQPIVGWVESRYLTPEVSCEPLGSSTIQTPPTSGQITNLPPAGNPPTAVKVTCDVLPESGLVVRSQPLVAEGTFLTVISPGTYEFVFSDATRITQSEGTNRRWVYITVPVTGWVTLGLEGSPSNLGGDRCS